MDLEKDTKVAIKINNLSQFHQHIERMQKLVGEINKEIKIINDFEFDITNY